MQALDPDEPKPVGTHVDMEASVSLAAVADVPLLKQSDTAELPYVDFDFLTTSDVSKLEGLGWKSKKGGAAAVGMGSTRTFEPERSVLEDKSLHSVLHLEDALARFDLDRDGKLNEREQAALYRTIEGEMKEELDQLIATRQHHAAAKLYARKERLRGEVVALQRAQEAEARAAQRAALADATALMQRRLREAHAAHVHVVQARLDEAEADLEVRHGIERENLERELAREVPKKTKFSKRYLELQSTEAQLMKGGAYLDSAVLSRKVDALEPLEIQKGVDDFLAGHARRRAALGARQAHEATLLQQKNLGLVWHDRRARDAQAAVNARRWKHHARDLAHAQAVAQHSVVPELSHEPSHLRYKRANFESTAAAHRGDHLKSHAARGGIAAHDTRERFNGSTLKRLGPEGRPVHAAPRARAAAAAGTHNSGPELPALTTAHDFRAPQLSTETTEWVTHAMLRKQQHGLHR